MRKSKGFTLIELMVVILIVAILAAVLAPMMTGRVREAKWTEGKTAAGTIATAIRAFIAENEGLTGNGVTLADGQTNFNGIGVTTSDLLGKYFQEGDYVLTTITYTPAAGATPASWTYLITVNPPSRVTIGTTATWTLDQDGVWTYTPDI